MLISQPGTLAMTSAREGGRMGSVADYLNAHSVRPEDSRLPLRALLAKHLVEKKRRPLYHGPVQRGNRHG
jgi:hypothetical protein